MNPDGTVNRAALPTVFNPEDLKALEMALQVKDKMPGSHITVITMGPQRAAQIIKDSCSRGADYGFVLSDARFAGSDTLATSYALSQAIRKLGHVDLVFCGRQAIDGDTAQVGPQVAEKLDLPQITYAETLCDVNDKAIVLNRRLADGVTVTASAPDCRYPHAHRLLKLANKEVRFLNADDVDPDLSRLGLKGSPTKVKKIDNIVLSHKESQQIAATPEALSQLMSTLSKDHIIS